MNSCHDLFPNPCICVYLFVFYFCKAPIHYYIQVQRETQVISFILILKIPQIAVTGSTIYSNRGEIKRAYCTLCPHINFSDNNK